MSNYDFANDSMLEMYLFESTTLLDQLDDILLQSEKEENLSEENINEIFRIMHTIKGSSAMMEFEMISKVSHKLEDLFFIIRANGLDDDIFHELFDLVLKVSDFLKDEIEKIQQNKALSTENDALIDEILEMQEILNGHAENNKAASAAPQSSQPAPSQPAQTATAEPARTAAPSLDLAASEGNTYHLQVYFNSDSQMENIRAFMLLNKLEAVGQVTATIPQDLTGNKEAAGIIANEGFYCTLVTNLSEEAVQESVMGTLSVESVSFLGCLPGGTVTKEEEVVQVNNEVAVKDTVISEAAPKAAPAATSFAAASASGDSNGKGTAGKQNLINVDLNKLDTLMNLVGEIVITESMVSGSPDLAGLDLDNFDRAARQLRKLTDELQDIVMSIRMVPVASTFQKMRRIVRDMGKKLDKDVELVLMGESTEVDKTIIDGIADPLMHLVRNAMDHAIETKADRSTAKKDPVGKIILSAQNVGGDIIISVSDDGKGLDPDYILEKAKAKNLLTKPENEYTDKEIYNLITLPGFSTKEAVTEFSGRGVGMDVVKKNIEKIGGTVTIESTKGLGTNVFFKIPLTLAIIASMEIKVGGNVYAIPIANIRESFKAASHQLLSDPDKNEMIMIRGVCYPIIRLHEIFHLEDTLTKIEDGILLLVDSGDRLACIFADELLGKHQVVVKPLPIYLSRYVAKNTGIAGCTILGDGSISLILDVQGILNQF